MRQHGRAAARTVTTASVAMLGLVALLLGTLGSAIVSTSSPTLAGASVSPTIFVSNTGNGLPGTVTEYPMPSTGDTTPSATLNSPTPGVYHPVDVAFDSSGDLWVPDPNTNSIDEYSAASPAQLAASGNPAPHVVITGDSNYPFSLAFDPSGNLWVLNADGSSILEYAKANLASSGSPSPTKTITSSSNSIDGGSRIAFDSSGDLWVTNTGNQTVDDFTPAKLSAGGAQAAATTLTATSNSLDDPVGLTFDASGDLWVANSVNNTVVGYLPAQVTSGGALTPNWTLGSDVSSSIANPYQVQVDNFNASPTLWVANSNHSTLSGYTLSALSALSTGSTTPTPNETVSADNAVSPPSVDYVEGFAFDTSGDMWLGNYDANDLVELTQGELYTSHTSAPTVVISSSYLSPFDQPVNIALDGSGDLWVANADGDDIAMFPPGANGTTKPTIVIGSGRCSENLCGPYGLAFDRSGDLWVANHGSNQGSIDEYSAAQLASSGDPTPVAELFNTGVANPESIAFDAAGDLWVASNSNSKLIELSASQLAAASVTPSPPAAVVISGLAEAPSALAIDPSGDLWWSDCGDAKLTEFTAGQLTGSGSPPPAAVLTAPEGCSQQLAFDTAGDLWQSGYGSGPVGDYTPAQLSAAGVQSPTNAITGADTQLDFPAGLALGQAPATPGAVTASLSGGSASVTWTAPFSLPWAAGYSVTPVVNGVDQAPVALGAAATSYTLPGGVTPGDKYAFVVAASNAFGSSAGVTSSTVSSPAVATGYWEVASDGGVFSFGGAPFYGSAASLRLNQPVVGMAATPHGQGYWEVAADGGVFNYGNAGFYGSAASYHPNARIVGIAGTSDGSGYWEVGADGGVFAFGDAPFFGSAAAYHPNKPVVGMAATPDGGGYWEVSSDGGVFAFGDAKFWGTAATLSLNKPVVGVASTLSGKGYWEVAADGGVFTYGDAHFYGSNGATPPTPNVVGLAVSVDGGGYLEAGAGGSTYGFGDDTAAAGVMGLNAPLVGIAPA